MKKAIQKGAFLLGLAGLLISNSTVLASSGGGHGAPSAKAMSTAETIKTVIQGNDSFTSHTDSQHFDSFQTGQVPNLTVITCSDSRVHTHLFGMEPDNNIFIIRNVGNQINNSEGSVDYGVRHLPTKILLVMGHSSCGAVKAAMGDYSGETKGIKKELDTLKPVIAHDDGVGAFESRWAMNVERNVDYQVKYALDLYKDKVSHGEMVVVGGVYDFNNIYGKGRGMLVITNINGETNPNAIMNHEVLKELNKGDIVNHVSSRAPAVNW